MYKGYKPILTFSVDFLSAYFMILLCISRGNNKVKRVSRDYISRYVVWLSAACIPEGDYS